MEQTEIVLTPAERLILNSYRDLVCGLEDYLGIGYEIVLHSLESMEHSVLPSPMGTIQIVTRVLPLLIWPWICYAPSSRRMGKAIFPIFPATAAANRCAPLPSLSMVKTAGHWPAVYQLLSEHPPL